MHANGSPSSAFNVLLIGSGGREHALAWKLSQSVRVNHIYVAPGNGGTSAGDKKISNVDISVSDFQGLVEFAKTHHVELVVVGPEQPLVDGISGVFKKCGIACFGPSASAARLEGSKAFSKDFMKSHGIPTAEYQVFTEYENARNYVDSVSHGVVIKASGLAAGKGVIIPQSKEEAVEGLKAIMLDKTFGQAGNECVIEEYLEGEECSILAFSDGYSFVVLPASQDHKRIFEGDQGPNTGGMGAYAPAPVATPAIMEEVKTKVLKPTIDGMRKSGHPFVGILYAGIMVTKSGIKVLEFNCRFGDPETQVVIPLLSDDSDLAEIMLACTEGRLDSVNVSFKDGYAATVVAAAEGYPNAYSKGQAIAINPSADFSGAFIFHAGTSLLSNQLVTSGGRVLSVTGYAKSLKPALDLSYAALQSIKFCGMQYRQDIGHRALSRLSKSSNSVSYEDAGVSIDRGNLLVDKIKAVTKATRRPGSDAVIGGFGGLFDLQAAGYDQGNTVLVSATDGVGTKLKVAQIMNKHDTIGIDLVAMNVNDLIVQGAEPLLFLDYFACGALDVDVARDVVTGIAEGCKQANCALVGGETAEMPGLYTNGDYDLAGFTVGAVKKDSLLPLDEKIVPGDILLGVPSSGIHSNGYSLVRHLVGKGGYDYHSKCPFDTSKSLGEVLLTPTRIYVRSLLPVVKEKKIKAMAHITGGGFIDNIPRVLPEDVGVLIDGQQWSLPPVFKWLKKVGNMNSFELSRTFNCGVGMVLVVSAENAASVVSSLKANGEPFVYTMGIVVKRGDIAGEHSVRVDNTESW